MKKVTKKKSLKVSKPSAKKGGDLVSSEKTNGFERRHLVVISKAIRRWLRDSEEEEEDKNMTTPAYSLIFHSASEGGPQHIDIDYAMEPELNKKILMWISVSLVAGVIIFAWLQVSSGYFASLNVSDKLVETLEGRVKSDLSETQKFKQSWDVILSQARAAVETEVEATTKQDELNGALQDIIATQAEKVEANPQTNK